MFERLFDKMASNRDNERKQVIADTYLKMLSEALSYIAFYTLVSQNIKTTDK